MEFKDYYQVLGVARDATQDAVKKAYRKLARQFHPDVSKAPDASARMSEVNEAYAVLSDPERRAAYDKVGRGHQAGERFTPPPDWDAGFEFQGRAPGGASEFGGDFSDFFEQLFGRAGMPRGAARHGRGGAMRGEDHHAKIVLELEAALRGGVHRVSLRQPQLGPDGHVVLAERTLEVTLPPGVRPGRLVRLAGQGGPGQPPGDLFLEVVLHEHPRWRVDGADLVGELPVAPWEAALGGVLPVALPDGSTLQVRVPAGAQAGQRLTLRGRGLPGTPPGDLDLVVRVVLPSALEPRARALYERMAQELPDFDARKVAAAEAQRRGGDER
ncbi:DnaJ C-terminal domain-containing protein [Rubrivivax gelatinosus]|uniref:Curved DNA-binding protein n=1 Tax=Rubrivivax gelatinosus TaxID=28068 RepID=A0A4V2SFK5_RUBGE|nr:DnaJ C-terminal domain-containing protein [Rubrivivax gelatinosus]MBK1690048.1 molecular chaperone DnaJ [Rubrivivax gelatinosus]TCO97677.1 curved DNA-binding protein [Rubrivivax gelatinosus]